MNTSHKFFPAIFAGAMGLAIVACSDKTEYEGYGEKGEMELSATVGKPITRMADNAWEGGEEIGVRSADEEKIYTVDADGNMSTSDDSPFRWEGEPFDMEAWYPYDTEPVMLADQSDADKFYACDLLYSRTTAISKSVNFTFSHKMTRMWWGLQTVEGYTEEEIAAARVTFYGYASATYDGGAISPEGNPDCEIATLEDEEEYRTGEALLVPCEMWDKPLIKVEIGGSTYVYTPVKAEDTEGRNPGVLAENTIQRYYLSVTKERLSVEMKSDPVGWDGITVPEDDVTDASLRIAVSEDVQNLDNYTSEGIANGIISDRNNGFTISYTESGTGGLLWSGSCNVERSETPASGSAATVHTYRFYNIKSDMSVSYLPAVQEGHYFYDNGTWGPEATVKGCTTIGRVFKAGKSEYDSSDYGQMSRIRGYVVCTMVQDATERAWITEPGNPDYVTALQDIPISSDQTVRENDYSGCSLTASLDAALSGLGSSWETSAPFWYAFKNAQGEAPACTSGWYIPTVAQLKDIHESGYCENLINSYLSSQVYVGTSGTAPGIEEGGTRNTIWVIRYNASVTGIQYGWSGDAGKLIMVLTF